MCCATLAQSLGPSCDRIGDIGVIGGWAASSADDPPMPTDDTDGVSWADQGGQALTAEAELRLRARDGHGLAATFHRGTGPDCVVIAGATGVRRQFYGP